MSNFNRNNNGSRYPKKTFKREKPTFVKVKVNIADSDFYASNIDSLYNLLCSIPFDKVAVPVHMSKSELYGRDQRGTAVAGIIEKFNNDNTFTVSVQESIAEKITDTHVMSIRCRKDYDTGEITYVSSFCIVKGKSVQDNFSDVEQAMIDSAATEETTTEDTAQTETTTTEETETTTEEETTETVTE